MSSIGVSATMKVAAEAQRLRAQGVDLVDLGAGEPDFPTPDNIKLAAVRALDCNFTKYTAVGGALELKTAVCDAHARDFGTGYTPAECIVTVGGKHAVFNFTQAVIDPGDEVVIPSPSWVTYKEAVRYAGGECVFVETAEARGFAVTAADIEPRLTPRTKLIIVNSPLNPAGGVVERAEFEKILRLASARGIYLLTDECYCRFLYGSQPYSVASEPGAKETVLVAGSLSKTYSMTGWRIGFGLAPEPVIAAMNSLQSHCTSNPNSIAQMAAVEALMGPQDSVAAMLSEYRRRRDLIVAGLRAIPGVTCVEPCGAFYAYPNVSAAMSRNGIASTIQFAERLLAEARVVAVPGEAFGTRQHIRLSFAASVPALEEGLARIRRFVVESS